MLEFIFKDGNKAVDPKTLPTGQRNMFDVSMHSIKQVVDPLRCSKHGKSSKIVILLNISHSQDGWKVHHFWCSDFAQLVESKVTPVLGPPDYSN